MEQEPEPADDSLRQQLERRIGQTLCGRYTLEKLLGIGGMASVYRGTHRNGNRVAVKVLHTELCASREIRERFLREGYVANRVDHPGAVRVLDDDTADGIVFLVMELLEGETLEAHILRRGGCLSAREAVPLACQVLDVLAAAHEKGIVHRDIKPENLFIEQRDGSVKVLDFGIARLEDKTRQATRTGRVMGTPVYMAPEQARGETKLVDGQTDVWAVGAVLLRALTGRFVHEAETPEMTLVLAATQSAPRLRDLLPGADVQIAEIVDRALATNKAERWRSATAMATALRGLRPEELSDQAASQGGIAKTLDMTLPLPARAPAQVAGGAAVPVSAVSHRGAGLANLSFDDDTEAIPPTGSAPARALSARGPSTTSGMARSNEARGVAKAHASLLIGAAAILLTCGAAAAFLLTRTKTVPETSVLASSSPATSAMASAIPSASEASTETVNAHSLEPLTGGTLPAVGSATSAVPASRLQAGSAPAVARRAGPSDQAAGGAPSAVTLAAGVPSATLAAAPAASVCAPKKFPMPDGTWQWKMECSKK